MELTEEEIDVIGGRLESNGLSHSAIDEHFLAHYGVKGMKWGERRARKIQSRIDVTRRVAAGTGDKRDRFNVGLNAAFNTPLQLKKHGIQGVAEKRIDRAEDLQHKIAIGQKKVTNMLLRVNGIKISKVNYDLNDPESFTRSAKGESAKV